MMTDNKVVIRRLPPSMTEDDLVKQISPLADHDHFCFFEANSGLGKHSFGRAYINFLKSEDSSEFCERFNNYVFLDKDGHEYSAIVQPSLWPKSPKAGPFYATNIATTILGENDSSQTNTGSSQSTELYRKPEVKQVQLEQDPDFIEFLDSLKNQRVRSNQSPTQTLEGNLGELTNKSKLANKHNRNLSHLRTL